jgi:hypothetical protein
VKDLSLSDPSLTLWAPYRIDQGPARFILWFTLPIWIGMVQESNNSEAVCIRFNRLIQSLMCGKLNRNSFDRWEVDLMLDLEHCVMRPSAKRRTLLRYQKAVTRQLESGAALPFRLSEYMRRNGVSARPQRKAS